MNPTAVIESDASAIRQRYAVTPISQQFAVPSKVEGQKVSVTKVLHVDDNLDMREIAKVALEVVGKFDLLQCSDGESAIEAARTFKPDLLVLDVMMPSLSGPQIYEKIQSIPGCEKTPAIYLTVKAQDSFAAQLRQQGAIGVIAKPFDPMHLAEEVRAIWKAAKGETSY